MRISVVIDVNRIPIDAAEIFIVTDHYRPDLTKQRLYSHYAGRIFHVSDNENLAAKSHCNAMVATGLHVSAHAEIPENRLDKRRRQTQ